MMSSVSISNDCRCPHCRCLHDKNYRRCPTAPEIQDIANPDIATKQAWREVWRWRKDWIWQRLIEKHDFVSLAQLADFLAYEHGTLKRSEDRRAEACRLLILSIRCDQFGRPGKPLIIRTSSLGAPIGRFPLRAFAIHAEIMPEQIEYWWAPRPLVEHWCDAWGLRKPPRRYQPHPEIGRTPLPAAAGSDDKMDKKPLKIVATEAVLPILDDDAERPPPGHGRVSAMARKVAGILHAQGAKYEQSSIEREIRETVREWERTHPGR